MNSDQNKETLIELFENMGPGKDAWCAAYDKALAVDCSWWIQGWPIILGCEEAKAQVAMLGLLNIDANPIESRNIESFDNGKRFVFERKGSVTDAEGNVLADWDIMGLYSFNDDGKISSIRDYFDKTSLNEVVRKAMPEEQLQMLYQVSRESHPLNPNYQADGYFYRKMREQLGL